MSPAELARAAQARGADPRASAFVSANAGSGKTRVLVDRAARLLLAGARPSRILCLTFTKIAASEMKDRLFATLGGWAIAPDETLDAGLRALTGEAQDLAQARHLFARALDTPGGLNVQTIHAFCERLLRNFPVEAGLDPGFTVLEEPESQRLLLEARRDIAIAAQRDPDGEEAHAFATLAAARSERALGDLFGWIMLRRHRLSNLFETSGGLDGVLRAMRARLGAAPNETAEAIKAEAWARAPLDDLRASVAAALDRGSDPDKARATALAAVLENPGAPDAWDHYFTAVRTEKGARRSDGLFTKSVREAAPIVEDLFGRRGAPGSECARIDAVQERLSVIACADLTCAALTLAHRLIAAYGAHKARARALDFSDLIHRARALLMDSAARDWVRYRLDGGVDHILVDEAQDNSPEQWDIVDAAAAEFFAGAGAAETGAARTLFAVGDEKQSIFSFQGAAPALFRRKIQEYSTRAHDAGLIFHAPPLEMSFRSAPVILRAVDAVFASEQVATKLYAGAAEQDAPPQGDIMPHIAFRDEAIMPGCVELWPALPAAETAGDGDPAAPVDTPDAASPSSRLAALVARHIADMIGGGEGVQDRETGAVRAMRPDDVLILVRRRGAFFEETIRQLKKMGLPVAGADRMVLTGQIAVKDLLALGRFALLPEDDLSLAELLRSPFFQPYGGDAVITEDALFDLAHPRTGRLWDALRETGDPRFAEARDVLQEVLGDVGVAAPYEFFAQFLNRIMPEGASMMRRLRARLGPEAEDPVEEFLSRALAHQRRGAPSLQGFLAAIESESAEIKREMEVQSGVRVMTVHGAKGLEAPVVILPDTTSYKRRPGEAGLLDDPECGLIWSPKKDADPPAASALRVARDAQDEAEYLRLLYVALTRARDRLIVCGGRMGPRGGKNPLGRMDEGCWHELVEAGMRRAGAQECDTPAGAEPGPGLRLGAPAGSAASTERAIVADMTPPDWTRAPAPIARAARTLAPSHLLDPDAERAPAGSPLGDERAVRFRRGSLIHKLLELLPALPAPERAAAGRAFLARCMELDGAARDEMLEAALRVLEHPDFAEVFGPDSRAEIAITGALPDGRRIAGAIDRLYVAADAVLAVDIKTNRPPPARIEDADPAYLAQMAAYRAALAAIFPGHHVRCALLWTDGPALMEVPAAMMDDALQRLSDA